MEQNQKNSNNDSSTGNNINKSKLETGMSERSVWLMKCPVVVSNSWKTAADNEPISNIVASLDPLRPESPSFLQSLDPLRPEHSSYFQYTMEMANNEAKNMPKSYSLNMLKDFVPMSVFSETSQGKVAVQGKVEQKFDMKPNNENMEEYIKMCRERTNKSMIKNRQIQVIDKDRGVLPRPMPNIFIDSNSSTKRKKPVLPVKATDVKRIRRDRSEIEDLVFKLFERQPNWTLKQLVQETDQPTQFLKEILNELCVYNKRGSNQGTYELKPEYKKSVGGNSS